MQSTHVDDAIARAAAHGLTLNSDSVDVIEAGLDYRVVIANDVQGQDWVLRVPRRADVAESMGREMAILDLVRPRLSAAVPDWRVRAEDLVAYPLLPGSPGLTVVDGEPRWHMDPASPQYAAALGALLAELHRIDVDDAREAGVEIRSPEAVRQRWHDDIAAVRAEFDVADDLLRRWTDWVSDDSFWPDRTVLTHGELYPAHVLLDEAGAITGVLDWTTARVDDPGRDFAHQYSIAGEEAFTTTVDAYVRAGGSVWPRLADHCAELWAAGPVAYGVYALATGDPDHREAAAAELNPGAY